MVVLFDRVDRFVGGLNSRLHRRLYRLVREDVELAINGRYLRGRDDVTDLD